MNRIIITSLKKASLFAGALFLGWAAQAQTTPNTDSTSHHYGMHHNWSNRGWNNRRGGFNQGHDGRFGREGIHYTPQQRQQVAAINKEYRQQSADLFKQDNLTLRQYKAGLLALQKDKKDKLAALLTPQQKQQQIERQKRREENVRVMAAARLERMKLRLNLNDDQVAKIKATQESLLDQAKAIHDNDNLLPQEKREQMKTLMAKRDDNLKAVLTPEQYSQFQKQFHRRPGGFGGPGGRHFS